MPAKIGSERCLRWHGDHHHCDERDNNPDSASIGFEVAPFELAWIRASGRRADEHIFSRHYDRRSDLDIVILTPATPFEAGAPPPLVCHPKMNRLAISIGHFRRQLIERLLVLPNPVLTETNSTMDHKPFNEPQQFALAISEVLNGINPLELYHLFNEVARLRYVHATNTGYLLLCPRPCPLIPQAVALDTPIPLRSIRGVRKVLQVTMPTLAALSEGHAIYGYIDPSIPGPGTMVVRFEWSGVWRLTKNGHDIIRINAGGNDGDIVALCEDQFYQTVRQVFGSTAEAARTNLWQLVQAAQRQRHGTNVLISGNAAEEALRLNSQCTRVKPFALTPAIMEQVTSLDGTVLIDPNGMCHAVGAILDGFASDRGDRSRGGRYNSALMYVDSRRIPSLILVVSEDGMIDLIFRQPGGPCP